MNKLELQIMANEIRKDIITSVYSAKAGHPGGSLSAADVFTYLYFEEMNIDPKDPQKPDRDRFVLSKGHTAPGLYAALARRGYFPVEDLITLRHVGSYLQGHPDMKKTPGIDMTSGSLGNGLSAALGMAIYLKHEKKDAQVYCILGDGECQEGTVWEAVLSAPAMGIDNLTAIVDCNHLQSCGSVTEIMHIPGMSRAWENMGWHVISINGHDMNQIVSALEEAANYRGKPTCIMANTVKGKGISFMEFNNDWHQKIPTEAQYLQAIKELEEERACL